jgi:hypothetical protein
MLSFPRTVEVVAKLFGEIRFPFSVITAGLPSARLLGQHVNGAVCHFSLKFPSSIVQPISVRIVESAPPHSLKPGHSIPTNLP